MKLNLVEMKKEVESYFNKVTEAEREEMRKIFHQYTKNNNIDIISQIEGWSKRGIYIDYTTTDRYANGNKEFVDNGYCQRYSYTVCINDGDDFISELRYDDLCEGLQDALDYANKNLGGYYK